MRLGESIGTLEEARAELLQKLNEAEQGQSDCERRLEYARQRVAIYRASIGDLEMGLAQLRAV